MAENRLSVDPWRGFVVSFGFPITLAVVAVLEEEEVEHVEGLEAGLHTVDVVACLVVADQEVEVENLGIAGVAVESEEGRDVDVAGVVELGVVEVVKELLVLVVVQGLAGRSCRLRDP